MPSAKSLRYRALITSKCDQLAARLETAAKNDARSRPMPPVCPTGAELTAEPARAEDGEEDCSDDAALQEAGRLLIGVAMHRHAATMAIFLRTLIRELDDMQPEIDAAGWNWFFKYDADGNKVRI